MSRTGWWFVAATRPDLPADWRGRFLAAVEERRSDPRIGELLEDWRAHSGSVVPVREVASDGHLQPAADRLDRLCWLGHLDEQWLVGMQTATLGHEDPALMRMIGTRKLSPYACLMYGLGPLRVDRLPGTLGNVLLTPQELVAALPVLRSAVPADPEGRAEVLARMSTWIAEVGDCADTDPADLLDALPEVAGAAAGRGMGLLAIATDL